MKKIYNIFLSKTNDPGYSKPLYTTQAIDLYSCSCQSKFNFNLKCTSEMPLAMKYDITDQPNHSKRCNFRITATGSYSVITYSHLKLVKEMQAGYISDM